MMAALVLVILIGVLAYAMISEGENTIKELNETEN
jgi:hypothetical protein